MKAFAILVLIIASINCEFLKFESEPVSNDAALIIGIITKCVDVLGTVVDKFKTTIHSDVKAELEGKGFRKFVGSGEVFMSNGIKDAKWDRFTQHFLDFIQMDEEFTNQVKDYLEMVQLGDANAWTKYDMNYVKDSSNDHVFSSTIMACHNDNTNKTDVLYSAINADFKLAKNVCIIEQSRSFVGGIFSDNKIIMKESERDLAPEELRAITTFFEVVSISIFAEYFGIEVKLPN